MTTSAAYSHQLYIRTRERKAAKVISRLYGLAPSEYDALLREQGGRCGLCGEGVCCGRSALCVDHRHDSTRAVRGLLCIVCNNLIEHRSQAEARFGKERISAYLAGSVGWKQLDLFGGRP